MKQAFRPGLLIGDVGGHRGRRLRSLPALANGMTDSESIGPKVLTSVVKSLRSHFRATLTRINATLSGD
jgi:hypothetical protein